MIARPPSDLENSKSRHRGRPFGSLPCHTTRHAGPHRAVREVEVMRDGAVPVDPTSAKGQHGVE